jgi:beta-phosphoglucomutase-like phosphatase (HAD superfamily)
MDDDIRSLLNEADHVLIAFDGPLCTVFDPNAARSAAQRLRILLGPDLPRSVARTADPFEVLRYAGTCGEHTAHVVERQLSWLEAEAVASGQAAEGAVDAVHTLHLCGHTVTVVGNQSVEAIRSFVVVHDLVDEVRWISARGIGRTTKLLPDPFLLTEAVEALGTVPRRCLFVGASAEHAEAGAAAGMPVLRIGKTIAAMSELADRNLLEWRVR